MNLKDKHDELSTRVNRQLEHVETEGSTPNVELVSNFWGAVQKEGRVFIKHKREAEEE